MTPKGEELRAAEALRAASEVLSSRLQLAAQLGMTFGGKRDMYGVLGYPTVITALDYRMKYKRGGIAARVVDALPKVVWRGDGTRCVIEDEDPEVSTKFEQEFKELNQQLRLWSTLQRGHILASLTSFSVLLLGAPGSFEEELPKGKPGSLLYMTPFGGGVVEQNNQLRSGVAGYGADVSVATWDQDIRSPRFGQPLTYNLRRMNISSPEFSKPVHWSRVLHIPSSGFLDDAVFGPPVLETIWNYLEDLDKVVGGGAEAFWLRANQGLHIDVDKKMELTDATNTIANLQDQVDKYIHNMSRVMRTKGVSVETLGSDVADFSSSADALTTLIAGTSGIPKRLLTGAERGELASTQDRNNWADQVQDCRTNYAAPVIVRPLIDRLVRYGYLSKPKQYDVVWPEIASLSDTERIDAAVKAASLNDHGETVITSAEIRETYLGLEPLDEATAPSTEEAQVAQLEAALRKGGTLSLAVKS